MRLKWKPNIDAGQEAGPYEIYGRSDLPRGANLLFCGKVISQHTSWQDAVDAANEHQARNRAPVKGTLTSAAAAFR